MDKFLSLRGRRVPRLTGLYPAGAGLKDSLPLRATHLSKIVSGLSLERSPSTTNKIENQVSYDHRSYERSLSNCVQKPEKVSTSTGLEPVTSRSYLIPKSAVQYMEHFTYHFTSILHGLIRTHK